MDNSKKEIVTIYKEYEKISLLEYYIKDINDNKLESVISNLIDYYIDRKYKLAQECFHILKTKISDSNIFNKIIKISLAIASQKPLNIDLDDKYKIQLMM